LSLIAVGAGQWGTEGNETADQLAIMGSERPFWGCEPACNISAGVAKKPIMDWMKKNHR
jgi:hypothetical protein